MMDLTLDSEDQVDINNVVSNGTHISSSEGSHGRSVYIFDDRVYKIFNSEVTEEIKRLSSGIPDNLVPCSKVRTFDIDEKDDLRTVAVQPSYDESLIEKLEKDQETAIGDLIFLLDSAVENNTAMVDPVVENFGYFNEKLKMFDYCDIEAVKRFPDSYRVNPLKSFQEDIESMYEDAIYSISHETGEPLQDITERFENTSRMIEESEVSEQLYIGNYPEIKTAFKPDSI